MVFSSPVFLFYFLPFTIALYFTFPSLKWKNIFLLIASLFFYSWGESYRVIILIISILFNFFIGIGIGDSSTVKKKKLFLTLGLIGNFLFIFHYKYFGFFFENIQSIGILQKFVAKEILLLLGISFFTFQSISYLFDIYSNRAEVQRNPLNLGLYIALFPQFIAGPIIRYHDVSEQIKKRTHTSEQFQTGIHRFIIGLSKKVLIADPLALIADTTFSLQPDNIPAAIAWLGIICYSLQIYFDFSGYSDMAIGLGKMFGFDFLENFKYPYISKSIQEFWRRWHISLSNWFRDYLYIPLGGNRKGKSRTYLNLIIVFFITGLWHGASWNFIVWGLFHGFFLIIERIGFLKILKRIPSVLRYTYTLLIVIVGWVFFRAPDLNYALGYLMSMTGLTNGWDYKPIIHFTKLTFLALIVGVIFSSPLVPYINSKINHFIRNNEKLHPSSITIKRAILNFSLLCLFLLSVFNISSNTYSPFIYFRF